MFNKNNVFSLVLGAFIAIAIILTILSPLFIWNWEKRKSEVYLTDQDVIMFKKIFSPDSTKVILIYALSEGAFGTSHSFVSIMNTSDTINDISLYNIKNDDFQHHIPKWRNNDTITIFKNREYINDSFSDRKNLLFNKIYIIYMKD